MGLCLYVGMDDSNHAGENIKGEINAAIFSTLHQDSVIKAFPNRRDHSQATKWMMNFPERDYRFTLLTGEDWRTQPTNLIYTAPVLISSFLKDNPDMKVDSLRLYLDGYLSSAGKAYLRSRFSYIGDFAVKNFVKKNRNKEGNLAKRPVCPPLVYMADNWAHILLRRSLAECLTDSRYVLFSPQPSA